MKTTWQEFSEDQQFECLELLRHILQTSADATIEDVNRALVKADSTNSIGRRISPLPISLSARGARAESLSPEDEIVRQRLGISRERWKKHA